jgi:hypothetical protein
MPVFPSFFNWADFWWRYFSHCYKSLNKISSCLEILWFGFWLFTKSSLSWSLWPSIANTFF